MTALYSVNLRVMGRSNLPFLGATTLSTLCEDLGVRWFGAGRADVFGWEVSTADLTVLLLMGLLVSGTALALWAFLKTDIGTAMRASGDNPQMVRALGGNVEAYRVFGLALSNGLALEAGVSPPYQPVDNWLLSVRGATLRNRAAARGRPNRWTGGRIPTS